MRVSEHFELGRSQPTLDFVDVDVSQDARVFLDPRALRLLPSDWGDECVALVQSFFTTVLDLIKQGEHMRARGLLGELKEPNETHLGLSRGKSRGRALGPYSATIVWDALRKSEAVSSGLLEDLEDSILMIRGIGPDIISDITTNIIRAPLVEYTQAMAELYGIPLTPDVPIGPLWDPRALTWDSRYSSLPMTKSGKLLLVPKVLVRTRMDYLPQDYYRNYLLEHLRQVELDAGSELVHLLKDGSPRVSIKSLKAKYGKGKDAIVEQTLAHPDVLRRYRAARESMPREPLSHDEIALQEGTARPDWDELLGDVTDLRPGALDAHDYERAVERLLAALFYPSLANPQRQVPLHDGRKRIDLAYTNVATGGFFYWLALHHPAARIFVECKNYAGDPANPELDQLLGRFAPSRGQVGLLLCRRFEDKQLFLRRCKDTASDGHGFIIPLDDDDLAALVAGRKDKPSDSAYGLLAERFDSLVM